MRKYPNYYFSLITINLIFHYENYTEFMIIQSLFEVIFCLLFFNKNLSFLIIFQFLIDLLFCNEFRKVLFLLDIFHWDGADHLIQSSLFCNSLEIPFEVIHFYITKTSHDVVSKVAGLENYQTKAKCTKHLNKWKFIYLVLDRLNLCQRILGSKYRSWNRC